MPEWMNIAEMATEQPEKRIHMERYEYAGRALAGKRVLDCACGMGYGSEIMRTAGCAVTGVDIDPDAIEMARQQYRGGAQYEVGDMYTVPMEGYDALVSFETLEHLERPGEALDRLPESVTEIIASAPIRPTVGWNPWHRSDFTHGSFCQLIERRFTVIRVVGQLWVDGKGDLYLMVHGKKDGWA